jgi:hypothetical protein
MGSVRETFSAERKLISPPVSRGRMGWGGSCFTVMLSYWFLCLLCDVYATSITVLERDSRKEWVRPCQKARVSSKTMAVCGKKNGTGI